MNKGENIMANWTENLTHKQVITARRVLAAEIRIADHIQARRNDVDGWATVEVFIGRRCYTVTIGPKGGIKSQSCDFVA
jgi:hypothetical protein